MIRFYSSIAVIALSFITIAVSAQQIEKSTVLTALMETKEDRDAYAVDNVAWGFLPLDNIENRIGEYTASVATIQAEGRDFHSRVEFDAGWKLFVEYCSANAKTFEDNVCKDLDGDPFTYPWFNGLWHNGKTAYWMSSHSPVFVNFLKYQIDKCLEAPTKHIMIDAQTSSALASKDQNNPGDFSAHSMEAFCLFMENTYTAQELAAKGIDNIATFNYKTYLQGVGINSSATYINRVTQHLSNGTQLPLFDDFRLFQHQHVVELMKEMKQYIDTQSGNTVQMGVSSPIIDPFRSNLIDDIDFFQQEMPMEIDAFTYDPVITYKIAESLGKPFVFTAEPEDWNHIFNNMNEEPVVEQWITEAYAHGANFIAPIKQWAYGTDWYVPSYDMSYHFQFISDNSFLFDDRSAVKGSVALIHSREAARKYVYEDNQIIEVLEANNIPYDIIIGGDEYYPNLPSVQELEGYERVIVSQNVYDWFISGNAELKTNLDALGTKLYKWQKNETIGGANIKTQLSKQLNAVGGTTNLNEKIGLFPRFHKQANSSYTIHILNKATDGNHQFVTQKDFSVVVSESYFENEVTSAVWHLPAQDPVELTIENNGQGELEISGFTTLLSWGVLELKQDTPKEKIETLVMRSEFEAVSDVVIDLEDENEGAENYTITGGNDNNYFSINSATGIVSIQNTIPDVMGTITEHVLDVSIGSKVYAVTIVDAYDYFLQENPDYIVLDEHQDIHVEAGDSYTPYNNLWGDGSAVPNTDYRMATLVHADNPDSTIFVWDVPSDAQAFGGSSVWSYVSVMWGNRIKLREDLPDFPIKIESINSLDIDFDFEHLFGTEGYKIALNHFLTDEDYIAPFSENDGDFFFVFDQKGTWVPPYPTDIGDTIINGKTFTRLYKDDSSPYQWRRVIVKDNEKLLSGTLDLAGVYQSFISRGYLNDQQYIPNIQIGLEITDGWGAVRLNEWDIQLNKPKTQTINLHKGWNLVSLNINPFENLPSSVFPNATTVKTFDSFYSPSQEPLLNRLTKIEAGKGYLVYNAVDETIEISGTFVQIPGYSFLQEGWNLIGVPIKENFDVSNLPAEAEAVKDFDDFYEKGNEFNSLYELKPSKGYFIKVNADCSIHW